MVGGIFQDGFYFSDGTVCPFQSSDDLLYRLIDLLFKLFQLVRWRDRLCPLRVFADNGWIACPLGDNVVFGVSAGEREHHAAWHQGQFPGDFPVQQDMFISQVFRENPRSFGAMLLRHRLDLIGQSGQVNLLPRLREDKLHRLHIDLALHVVKFQRRIVEPAAGCIDFAHPFPSLINWA